MPQWSVSGAFADTGRDATLLVEAPTADQAAEFARQKGVLVASITPSDPDTLGAVRLAYQPGRPRSPHPSDFRWLRWSAVGFRYVGLLLLTLTLLSLIVAVVDGPPLPAATLGKVRRVGELLTSTAYQSLFGLTCLAVAGLLDMARAFAAHRLTAPT